MANNKQPPVKPLGDIFAPIAEPIHSKKRSFVRRHLRSEIIVLAILVVLGGGASWAVFASPWSNNLQQVVGLQKKSSTDGSSSKIPTLTVSQMPKGTTQAQVTATNATQQLGQGDKTQAQQMYATAVSQATSNDAKAKILLQEASGYQSAQDYQDALTAAQQALTYVSDNSATQVYAYSFIGGIYQQTNDNTDAVTYYQKVVDALNANPSLVSQSGYSVQAYQQMIDSLRGGQSQ